jgi:toxin ParE1/3/4
MTLRILPRAVRYLAELRTTIAADDPEMAQKVGERIIKALRLIEERPDIGRPTACRESVRECAVPDLPYFIPYRVKDGNIEVLRVYHTRRNRPPQWPTTL